MANPEKQRAMAEKFIKGKISIRDWREQMNTVMGMCGPQTASSATIP